ncbi:MAG TPA: hypothetical protein VGR96_12650 [Acidobacteriaceae bacterium]|nr:hypothetical protein [Acidobacteriaceae bacterium]
MTGRNQVQDATAIAAAESQAAEPASGGLWRASLLLTTSAVLGGIAVAIWNRRTLARIRQQMESRDAHETASSED